MQLRALDRLHELRRELACPACLGQTVHRREEQERQGPLVPVAADLARKLEAVHLGHLHVEHGDIEWIAAADAGQRVRRPLDDLHEHLPRLREAPDDLPVRGVVVDEQQTLARERSLVVRRTRRRGGLSRDDLELERRAPALLALRRERAAHQVRQSLRDRKTQPGAAIAPCRRRVHLAERLEQAVHPLRRNPDAGIPDGEAHPPQVTAGVLGRDGQDDLPGLGELDCVREQVAKRLLQPRRVADDRGRHVVVHEAPQLDLLLGGGHGDEIERALGTSRGSRRNPPRARASLPRSSRSRGCRR